MVLWALTTTHATQQREGNKHRMAVINGNNHCLCYCGTPIFQASEFNVGAITSQWLLLFIRGLQRPHVSWTVFVFLSSYSWSTTLTLRFVMFPGFIMRLLTPSLFSRILASGRLPPSPPPAFSNDSLGEDILHYANWGLAFSSNHTYTLGEKIYIPASEGTLISLQLL